MPLPIKKINRLFPHILIVLSICLALRLLLALTSLPGGDLSTLMRWGNILADKGPLNFYLNVNNEQLSGINSTFWAAAEIYNWSQELKLPIKEELVFRLFPMIADFLNAFIIYALIKKFFKLPRPKSTRYYASSLYGRKKTTIVSVLLSLKSIYSFLHFLPKFNRPSFSTSQYKAKIATLVACLYLLNPAVFLMSADLGQPDSFAMLFILLSIYFLVEEKIILSSVFTGIGVAVKPWPVLTIPFFVIYIFVKNYKKNNLFKKISQILIFCSITIFIVLVTFYPYKPYENLIHHTVSRYLTMDRIQPYVSKFTLNFWSLIKQYPATDETTFSGLSYRMISIIIFATFFTLILSQFSIKSLKIQENKNRPDLFNLLILSLCLSFLAMYLFLTRMLARYLFFAVNLLYLSSISLPPMGKIFAAIFILAHAYNIIATAYVSSLNWGQSYVILFSLFNILFFFYLLIFLLKYKIKIEKY